MKHLRTPGIRAQLTLWYTVVFTVVFVIFGGVFLRILSASLTSELDANLQLRTQQVAAGISNENGALIIQDTTGELPGLGTGSQSGGASGDPTIPATPTPNVTDTRYGPLVRVLNARGVPVYTSPAFRTLTPPAASFTDPLAGKTWRQTLTASDGQLVRLESTMLTENGQIFGVVQVGQSLAALTETLRSTLTTLMVLAPFILLLTAIGSYWLTGRAFVPMTRLTRTARAINASDLHQRVAVPAARDEVRDLAVTLNAMIARLETSFAQQQRFVSDASHELRTPLAAMLSIVENASELDSPEVSASALHEISGELQRMGTLVTDLLALARSDDGRIALDREPARLDLLAEDVVASLSLLAEERGITLRAAAPHPITRAVDAGRIIQVLMALVDNALRYTPAGGVVTVSVASTGDRVVLSVADSGIGIAAVDLPHIFERFYRADHAHAAVAGGSGLGLAIADAIVRAHDGVISVQSAIGQGTTFTVSLPAAPPPRLTRPR